MSLDHIKITCQISSCDYFMTEPGKKICKNGYNSAGNQQYHFKHCGKYFVETKHNPLHNSRLGCSKVELLAKSSVESVSIRGLTRVTGINRDTISRHYHLFGKHAEILNKSHTVNIPSGECELNEIWSYI